MDTLVHRKDSIVMTAIDVMNEFGVQAISTKEVAKREGVTESAIFKHYPKKMDLIASVLEVYSKYDNDIYNTLKTMDLKPKEAMLYFFELFTSYYESYPAITSITPAFDGLRYHIELEYKIQEIIKDRVQCIKYFIEEGQKCGDIRKDLDKSILADVIIGTFDNICVKWRMTGYSFSLRERSLSAIEMILKAI